MRNQVADLVGDGFKRTIFGQTARKRVENRTWPRVCDQLLDYYCAAIDLGVRSPAKTG